MLTEETSVGNERALQKLKAQLNLWRAASLVMIGIFIFNQFLFVDINLKSSTNIQTATNNNEAAATASVDQLVAAVLPEAGVKLPAGWGNLGKQMVAVGVINQSAFEEVYASRGGLDAYSKNLLLAEANDQLVINSQTAAVLLNLLWALGLGNKNPVLDQGLMQDPQYGGAGNFASTGGWTVASGDAMDHYSQHQFITLNSDQQALVERVAQNIYRPCCGNATHFPDCNHGLAMLGLLELMAAQGVSEDDMYRVALQVNAYWFPDTYLTLAKYFSARGVSWPQVNAKEVLGSAYSSSQGYQQILAEVEPVTSPGGGGCGV